MAQTERADISLLDHAGEHLMWLTVSQAQKLIDEKRAEPVGTRRRPMRKVRFRTPEPDMKDRRFIIRGLALGGSHRHARQDNPEGVWTIDRLDKSTRSIFLAVVNECLVGTPTR
jgi:hypothetical protein